MVRIIVMKEVVRRTEELRTLMYSSRSLHHRWNIYVTDTTDKPQYEWSDCGDVDSL